MTDNQRMDASALVRDTAGGQRLSLERQPTPPPLRLLPEDARFYSAPAVAVREGGIDIIEPLAEEWRRVCEEGPSAEPFYRPEWIQAYVRAFGPAKRLMVITVRIGGRLRAVLPLIKERTLFCGLPVTKLRSGASNGHLYRFDAARGAGIEGDEAVAALWDHLKHLPGWDVLQFCDVPQAGALERLCNAARQDGFPTERWESMRSPYIPLSGLPRDKEPWLLSDSSNFRDSMRKRTRKLSARGSLRLQRVETADPHFIQLFYDLEAAGWKGKARTAIACHRDTRTFYDEIARSAARFGYLALYFLELNEQVIAAQFGLSHRGRYFTLKVAMNENYKEFGPGHLLINAELRDCLRQGLAEYDFASPWEEYKSVWASHVRPHSWFWVFREGSYGRLLHRLYTINSQLRARVRRVIHRGTAHTPRAANA